MTVPLRLDPARVHVPDGAAPDIEAECRAHEQRLADCGPVDMQILGIVHIGFNEPTSSFASRTRIKTLAPRTRADNARFFAAPGDVPTHCITQGLATILQARRLVLVATGAAKAGAVAATVEGPVSSSCSRPQRRVRVMMVCLIPVHFSLWHGQLGPSESSMRGGQLGIQCHTNNNQVVEVKVTEWRVVVAGDGYRHPLLVAPCEPIGHEAFVPLIRVCVVILQNEINIVAGDLEGVPNVHGMQSITESSPRHQYSLIPACLLGDSTDDPAPRQFCHYDS